MKIFIAGASGLLGKRVVKRLVEQGHEVVGLARSEANRALLSSLGAEARSGSLFDKEQMIAASEGCDAILHLATKIPQKSRTKPADWQENDRIRTEGAEVLTDAAIFHKVKLYLQQSILFLYGDQQGKVLDSNTQLPTRQPSFLRSAARMEAIVNEKIRTLGLPGIILRFASFYGPDSGQTLGLIRAIQKGKLPIVGKGDYYYNLIHLDDAASSVVFTVNNHDKLKHLTHNVSDFNPATFAEVVQYLATITQSKRPRGIPAWLAGFLLGREIIGVLTNSYQNRINTLADWAPEYASYKEGFAQVIKASHMD